MTRIGSRGIMITPAVCHDKSQLGQRWHSPPHVQSPKDMRLSESWVTRKHLHVLIYLWHLSLILVEHSKNILLSKLLLFCSHSASLYMSQK